ncbi:MAG: alpha/beta fold hydrolase [Gammaproteobacteria bacterium]|nr:alpha/beta fold hydrolase [Gammaproteobacteria bacterium]
MDYRIFQLGDVTLQSGATLPNACLAYQTWGELNQAADNVVLLPTFYTGTHYRNEGFFGPGRAIDPERHFIVSINLFGNGLSTSPSNADVSVSGGNFPLITLYDNVKCQYRLLTEVLKINEILLVAGWSMAGCQSYQWAAQYPKMVKNILPFCASAKTSPHNHVFLEGVKAALQADNRFCDGFYSEPPVRGLKAFGRVYAGWAFSQGFYREKLHQKLGFDRAEDLLQDWEADHLNWDANNLLTKLATWQAGDISDNEKYGGDFQSALTEIQANTIVIACDNDLYFPPEDNQLEIQWIKRGELRVYQSLWGHCVASPGNDIEFTRFLDNAINELIA